MKRTAQDGLVFLREPSHLQEKGLVWAAFSRLGGASSGQFSSLNVGYHVGDNRESVTENRSLIARTLSFPLQHLVAAQQVHGSKVAAVDRAMRGKGATSWDDAVPDTDALITRTSGTHFMVVVADCAALTFFDPAQMVLGIAHCGWRGMVAKLGQKTIEAMHHTYGSRPEDLSLIVSPSIGPCCYEVGQAVLDPLRQAYSSWQSFVKDFDGRAHLDLWEMARWQALDSGLKKENIHVADMCTACHTDLFYSHRAERGNTGRFAVVAGMSPEERD